MAREPAQYQAAPAARRYEAVDPDNRLVGAAGDARWNRALERVAGVEGRQQTQARCTPSSVRIDRRTLDALGTDLRTVWDAPGSEMRVRHSFGAVLEGTVRAVATPRAERPGALDGSRASVRETTAAYASGGVPQVPLPAVASPASRRRNAS